MVGRLTKLGYVLIAVGLVFVVAAGVAYSKTQEGYDSLSKFSEAQNVTLSYNEDGQLIDRGTLNLYWDYMLFDYKDFRNVLEGGEAGQEPLYSFNANVIRFFLSIWF